MSNFESYRYFFIFADKFFMDYLVIFLVAISLCFDTFAVSISSGVIKHKIIFKDALKIAFTLAFFQTVMPLAGWCMGKQVKQYISEFDHWVAFGILSILGIKMIIDSFKQESKKEFNPLNIWILISIAIATSIDAFAVGISFSIINVPIFLSVLIIGFVTFIVSMLGILFGEKTGKIFGKKIEIAGGIILIAIGIKILYKHLVI